MTWAGSWGEDAREADMEAERAEDVSAMSWSGWERERGGRETARRTGTETAWPKDSEEAMAREEVRRVVRVAAREDGTKRFFLPEGVGGGAREEITAEGSRV